MSHGSNLPTLKLFANSPLEIKDELEEKLERQFKLISGLLENITSEREINDVLTKHVSIGNSEHEDVCVGLLCKILSDRQTAVKVLRVGARFVVKAQCKIATVNIIDETFVNLTESEIELFFPPQNSFQNLMMVNRDSLSCVMVHINIMVMEKFRKMIDSARMQLFWLVHELIKTSANGCEGICMSLMKQIVGGDVSPRNVRLAEGVLDIFITFHAWLEKSVSLLQIAVYTYLRLLQDHVHQNFASLRQKEVNFVVSHLREKWTECSGIGRDLVRLLSAVARIPEIEKLWSDIIHKPEVLSPSFTGILSLLQTRTSRKFLMSRITPDMENKVNFLLHKVRFGNHKRYQEWFQRQYLSTADSHTLRSDLIRYICGCIHPSNDILGSDVIPRWAVIGWLLSTCTSRVATSYNNLALFWDWLFYSPEKNSIMDIEPGILVMYQSLRNHPAITTSLLDFLCRTMVEFHPPLVNQIRQGVHVAFRTILEKRVVQSLSPILDNPKLDLELRGLIRSNLQEFCASASADGSKMRSDSPLRDVSGNQPPPIGQTVDIIREEPMVIEDDDSDNEIGEKKLIQSDDIGLDNNAIFSDDEDQQAKKTSKIQLSAWRESPKIEPQDITADLEKLDDTLRDLIGQLQDTDTKDLDERCERMQDIVDHVLSLDEFDKDVSIPLSSCLTNLLIDHFDHSILKQSAYDLNDEFLESCVEKPLYVLYRNLCSNSKDDDSFSVLLSLLSEMYSLQQRLGYHLLFFLAVKKQVLSDNKMYVYEHFAQNTRLEDVYNCLMMDMKQCQEDDVNVLVFLLPHIYKEFPEHCVGNSELLNVIVAVIDPQQLEELQCLIMTGEFTMMKKDSVLNVLKSSLEWESFEQYCTWQLFAVHDISLEVVLPLVQKLNSKQHAEALSMLLLAFKNTKPTQEMVKHVISRQFGDVDRFATSLLRHWAVVYMQELTEHVTALLIKSKSRNTPPRKGLRQSVRSSQTLHSPAQPSTIQMLNHVDNLRKSSLPKSCNLFAQDAFIACLVHIKQHCDESSKSRFSELFAIADDDSDDEVLLKYTRKRSKPSTTRNTSRSKLSSSHGLKQDSEESESESSSDDDDFKRKRRRKAQPDSSDSD